MRKKLFPLLAAISALAAATTAATPRPESLRFSGGEFRITQFTDLHWDASSPRCAQTEATVRAVLQSERPQLAVLTGDVVTESPAMEGWRSVAAIFGEAGVPFVALMGNHDAEHASKDSIYSLLSACPYYVGKANPEGVDGRGNCVLEVYPERGGKPCALLYMLDSQDYPTRKELGHYDYIHFTQIEWYRRQSRHYTAGNGGEPLPALAFFHIPLPEYREVMASTEAFGHSLEGGVASADVNSGLMASLIDMGDVMGVFAGHDHDNDFAGLYKGLLLAYGRVGGADAYGSMERGARIIRLTGENRREMATYIATPSGREPTYYYPSGITSAQEEGMAYHDGETLEQPRQGVRYRYYEGKFRETADIGRAEPAREGTLPNFSIASADSTDHFGFVFETMLKIDVAGVYRFHTRSDDGSMLMVGDTVVVDNDSGHSSRRRDGLIALREGYHRLRLLYFEDYMGQELEVGIASRRMPEQPIPAGMLFLP